MILLLKFIEFNKSKGKKRGRIPVQLKPSPSYPSLHVQLKLSDVYKQYASS